MTSLIIVLITEVLLFEQSELIKKLQSDIGTFSRRSYVYIVKLSYKSHQIPTLLAAAFAQSIEAKL